MELVKYVLSVMEVGSSVVDRMETEQWTWLFLLPHLDHSDEY